MNNDTKQFKQKQINTGEMLTSYIRNTRILLASLFIGIVVALFYILTHHV